MLQTIQAGRSLFDNVFMLEVVVFVAEAIIYAIAFPKIEKTQGKTVFNFIKPILYALAANALSFGVGFLFPLICFRNNLLITTK